MLRGGARQGRRASSARATRARSSSRAARPRRSTSSRTAAAAATCGPGDEVLVTAHGAPLEHRAVADAVRGARRGAARGADRRPRRAAARRVREAALAAHADRRGDARLERARHGQPGARDRAAVPRARRAGAGRRRAGGAAPARRRAGARLRLLRVLGPQAVRPDRHRRAVGPRRAARGDAAVPGRRRHDRVGHASRRRPTPGSRSASRPARPTSPAIVGLGAAIDYVERLGLDAIAAHERELLAYAERAPRRGAGPAHRRHRAAQGRA